MPIAPHGLCSIEWLYMNTQRIDKCYLKFNKTHILLYKINYTVFLNYYETTESRSHKYSKL